MAKIDPYKIKEKYLKWQVSKRNIYIVRLFLPIMAQIDITKMSSRGQVVIPQDLREGFNEGDKIVVIRSNDQIILKRADKMDKQLKEDLEVAKRVEEAWKDIDEGRFKKMSSNEFLAEIRSWK